MRFAIHKIWLTTTYLVFSAQALPRPVFSYSVVNVDGGAMSFTPQETIFQTITESSASQPTIDTTVTATIIGTPSAIETTATRNSNCISSTATSPRFGPTVTVTVPEPAQSHGTAAWGSMSVTLDTSSDATLSGMAHTATITDTDAIRTTVYATVSVQVPAPTTTSYYDNGMWHTSYAIKPTFTQALAWNSTFETLHR